MELKKRPEVVNRERLEKIGQLVCEINEYGLAHNLGTSLKLGWLPRSYFFLTDERGDIVDPRSPHPMLEKLIDLQKLVTAN